MPFDFTCPHCGKLTNVADEYAGQTGPCSQCGQTITLPAASPFAGPTDAPPSAASRTAGLSLMARPGLTWTGIAILILMALCTCAGLPMLLLRQCSLMTLWR